jgi:hypothetical protein
MPISFAKLVVGQTYSRPTLATLWGYKSFNAIARGVITPKDDDKIILFVTEQASAEQYADRLIGNVLEWKGPNDHFAEDRMLAATTSGEEIHLFHRNMHHTDFTYFGKLTVIESISRLGSPSRFKFEIKGI